MSRLTAPNLVKIGLAVLFFPFIALLVLLIGIGAKNKKVIIEGTVYAVLFFAALSITGDVSAFAGLGSMVFSAVRSYMLRDLWLPLRNRKSSVKNQPNAALVTLPTSIQEPDTALPSFSPVKSSLASAISAVSAEAKMNKHRLPGDTYVTILETCQLLDAVVDAEEQQPGSDARFEYELSALTKEYLPAVLQGYLAIPPSLVQDRQPNGKSSNDELAEQLELLHAQAEKLHAVRYRQSSVDLTTTGNFLRERFSHHVKDGFDFGIK
ncbi:hypothetical protein [Glutamicibacter uratoxydans]|uniref:hypothetical protein n=1 Tax=Glutamicibacter uratoxydans TaxID=43667 RepID=UPI003D6FAF2A